MSAMASAPASPQDTKRTDLPSPKLTIDFADDSEPASRARPLLATSVSDPPAKQRYPSPMRQHKREASVHREIKETLDAQTEFTSDEVDGRTYHRINQYIIVEEVGRGSYGAVHRATDQFGKEFAVKEFSKTRLRKRAQSHILRQGPYGTPRNVLPRSKRDEGPLSPQLTGLRVDERNDALIFIREEMAIMKKLNHPNLVQLIEVLDDPEEDSLYMVMEMCKKGVIMKVGLDEDADPYNDESCRCWFRDLLLGIEYLHAQGVVHRDIKPDNLLLSEDEVLKVVDFGVSEMFDKPDNMQISKSAGSPAFMPPELCGKHQEVSGKPADIWSMGVTLYCLKYGKIPFNRPTVIEIYEAIKSQEVPLPEEEDPVFVDLLRKILEKDPTKRITMAELREHPWVTKGGTDPLLSAEDNCEHMIEPPNELELSRAFTRKMDHLLFTVKAIHKFQALLAKVRARSNEKPGCETSSTPVGDKPFNAAEEKAKAEQIELVLSRRRRLLSQQDEEADKGHAQEIGDSEPLLLGIGTGARNAFATHESTPDVVADSPTAVDFNVYDAAYEEALRRRMEANPSKRPTMYLTKFVKETEQFKKLADLVEGTPFAPPALKAEFKDAKDIVLASVQSHTGGKLADLIAKVSESNLAQNDLAKPSPVAP